MMKKNLTEIVFILDRSGSMRGLEGDTIGGFNAMIEKQKKEPGEALISTILFDNVSEVIHDRVPVQQVAPMTDGDYFVRGCTALLDAIGGAIHHIENVHKYAREEDVPEHTLFVITTDGMENASRSYDSERVKRMIERRKEEDDQLRYGKRHGGKEPSRKGVPRAHECFAKKVHHRPVFAQQKVRREPRERNEQHRMARRTQPPERPERYFLFLRCFHIRHFTPSGAR